MAQPEEPPRPSSEGATGAVSRASAHAEALILFVVALAVVIGGYLVAVVPGTWFPGVTLMAWSPRAFVLTRGTGGAAPDALVVTGSGGAGGALVTLETDFRSSDYPAVAWGASNVPDTVEVRVIWRTDYAPSKVNSAPVAVAAGHLLPVVLAGNPNWLGRIRGLGLAIVGPIAQPVRVSGVTAKPMGAVEIAGDRVAEWLAFERNSGTSIDGVTGGADVQDLPLPVLLAAIAGLAALAWFALARLRARTAALPAVLAALFVAAWLIQDARWTWNLVRQTAVTANTYAGLDWRERHLVAEDAALFRFIENVRAHLPPEPARVFMNADEHYLRDRGAYHLYPQNVYYEPYRNAIPAASLMRPGDFFIAYERRGVQYDPATRRLRWDGGEPVTADLLLSASGGALFRIR